MAFLILVLDVSRYVNWLLSRISSFARIAPKSIHSIYSEVFETEVYFIVEERNSLCFLWHHNVFSGCVELFIIG